MDLAEPGAALADLLADPALGLSLVAGPASARFQSVRWPGRPHDQAWLAPHDLRLHAADDRTTAPERLLRGGPAVLAYVLTPTSRRLPDGLAGRAAAAGTALVTVPPAVAPEQVETAALRALVLASAPAGPALGSPQAYLLAGLAGAKPERELLERLNRLTGIDLVLVSPWNEVVARAGTGAWRPREEAPGSAPVGAWREGAVRLGGRGALLYRLEVVGRLRGVLLAFEAPEWARPWVELTRTLLVAAAAMHASELRARSAAGGALLAAWLAAPESTERLAPQLARAGFAAGAPYRACVAEAAAAPRSAATAAREAGEDYFNERGVAVLAGSEGQHVTWVFGVPGAVGADAPGQAAQPAPSGDADALYLAAAATGTVRMGLSRPHSSLADVGRAVQEARLALGRAPLHGGLSRYEDVDPLAWLLAQPRPELEPLRQQLLGRLLAADPNGKLLATLTAYLDAPAAPNALAARLGVHVNTLRYRLRRIEELIGAPLTSPRTLALLWLATRQEL